MPNLIRNRALVNDDPWLHLDDDDAVPTSGDVTVSWQRWQTEKGEIGALNGRLGVRLDGDFPIEELDTLLGLPLIVVHFPAFKDGRCYSHARLLRTRHDYDGEIRATGDVLRDQIAYMERCGINAFEIRKDRAAEEALKAFDEFSVDYQGRSNRAFPLQARRD
ncbi:DUF934 domain-containing protein [Methylonatrum kenyense]|uniref:DUF934 domain-containing protein n=1 Tax=Methylonatrum kenyense TaxID=455253 RepID=UPI0020BF92CF|nr:DUF934 domain-containing protein [Methylonatrum kenyense]MCK8516419.1 DUF934 domain-containing protein [Methylonatrum kenyense]